MSMINNCVNFLWYIQSIQIVEYLIDETLGYSSMNDVNKNVPVKRTNVSSRRRFDQFSELSSPESGLGIIVSCKN